MKRIPFAGLVSLALAACGPKPAPPAPPIDHVERVITGLRPKVEIDRAQIRMPLIERMTYYHVPGVSIAVIDSGRIVWARGFGLKTAGTRDSVSPTTTFQAASISKAVTATATLRLVDQGKLDLDRPVNTYLKSWQLPENRFTAKEKVTLRRIMSHGAGLTVHGFPGYDPTAKLPTVPQILDGKPPANTPAVRVDTFPGAIWRYSGGGTTIEQLVLTDVTGQSFPDLLASLVFQPIGMTESQYDQPPAGPRVGQAAHGHDDKGSELPGGWHVYPELGPAGLWTTPTDLAKWALAITAAWKGNPNAILKPATAKAMLTPQSGTVGLGPFVEDSGQAFRFGHGGDNAGFHSNLWMLPETGQGAAVMTNGDGGRGLIDEIMFAIAAEYGWPDYAPIQVHPVMIDSATRASISGSYQVDYEGRPIPFKILSAGDTLVVETPLGRPERLVPESPTNYIGWQSGFRYEMQTDSTGRVTKITVRPFPSMALTGKKLEKR